VIAGNRQVVGLTRWICSSHRWGLGWKSWSGTLATQPTGYQI
jgi:hypothetical protein